MYEGQQAKIRPKKIEGESLSSLKFRGGGDQCTQEQGVSEK